MTDEAGGMDKALMSRRFSEAAERYEDHASFQRRAASLLEGYLPPLAPEAGILDVGCGTGILTRILRRRYPSARLTAIDVAEGMIRAAALRGAPPGGGDGAVAPVRWRVVDAETYRPARPFDLVASNCAVQWFARRERIGACLARLTAPGGFVALTLPVQGTLDELDSCVRSSNGAPMPGLPLWNADTFRAMMEAGGLWEIEATVEERIAEWFDSAVAAVRHIERIGAVCTGHGGRAPIPVGPLRRALALYTERYGTARGVPATYCVLVMTARRRSGKRAVRV